LYTKSFSYRRDVVLLEVQHNPQGCVDAAHLFETEMTHTVAESTGIDRRGLFSQHAGDVAIDLDLGPKACGPG
jgi:hypothetical protein